MDFAFGWGAMMLVGMVVMVLFWGLVIALAVWGIRALSRSERSSPEGSALEILKQRYARGEITREEYQQLRRDLED